ncbi:MAG: phage tail tape measure protein [Candidatus Caldatribacteriota bacterium]
MADVTLKFSIDVSRAKASLDGFRRAMSGLKLGDELTKSLEQQMTLIEKKMKQLQDFKITPQTDEATMKQFKKLMDEITKATSEVEGSFGKINAEIRQSTGLSSQHFDKLKHIQQINEGIRTTYQQTREALVARLTHREKELQLAQLEGRIASEQRESTKEKLQLTLENKKNDEDRLAIVQQIRDLDKEFKGQEARMAIDEERAKVLEDQLSKHQEIKQALDEKKVAYDDLENQTRQAEQGRQRALEAQKEGLDAVTKGISTLTDRMRRLAEFTVAAFALRTLRRFFQEGLGFVRDLDKSLTEIATVTHTTREEMWKMAVEFNRMGRELGRTTSEIAQASVIFYRQGLQQHEVLEMVRASTISAGIANTDTADASDRLTSALRGFLRPASEAMSVADKLAALAAQSASSFDELSYAMTKTAASAQVAGIDMDHLFAYIAKVIEATREAPENIGTAFKTIIARMQQVKEAGVIVEDGVTTPLNKVQEALEAVGVELLDHEGQLRDLQDVFRDLGREWDYMDRNTKAYLATIIAGSRQQSRFLALMNDFNRTNELITVSQLSAGEASKQFQTHLTGIEASLVRLKAAQEEFLIGLINPEHYKGAIDSLRTLLDTFSGIPPVLTLAIAGITLWTMKTIIAMGATVAKANAEKIRNVVETEGLGIAYQRVLANLKEAGSTTVLIGKLLTLIGVKKGVIATTLAMHAATFGLSVVIMAAVAAVGYLVIRLASLASARKLELERLRESIGQKQEEITVLEREKDQLRDLAKEHETLRNKVTRTADEEARLATLNQELSDTYGRLVVGVDSFGNVIIDTTSYIEEEARKIRELNFELLENRRILAEEEFKIDFRETGDEIRKLRIQFEQLTGEIFGTEGERSIQFSTPRAPARPRDIEEDAPWAQRKLHEWHMSRYEEGQKRIEEIRKQLEESEERQNRIIEERLRLQDQILVASIALNEELDVATKLLAEQVVLSVERPDPTEMLTLTDQELEEAFSDYEQRVQDKLQAAFTEETSEQFNELLRDYGREIGYHISDGLDVGDIEERISQFEADVADLLDIDPGVVDLTQFIIGPDVDILKPIVDFQRRLEETGEFTEQYGTELENLRQTSVRVYSAMTDSLNRYIQEWESMPEYREMEDPEDRMGFINERLAERVALYDELSKVVRTGGLAEGLEEAEKYLDAGNIALYNKEIRSLINGIQDLTPELRDAFIEIYEIGETIPGSLQGAVDTIRNTADAVKDLSPALDTLREGQALSLDQILNLVEAHQDLIYHLEVENGIIRLNQEGIEALKAAKLEAFREELRNHKTSLQAQLIRVETEIALMEAVKEGDLTMQEADAQLETSINNVEATAEAATKNMINDANAVGEAQVNAAKQSDEAWAQFYRNQVARIAGEEAQRVVRAFSPYARPTGERAVAERHYSDFYADQLALEGQRERDRAEAERRLSILRDRAGILEQQIDVLSKLMDADLVANIKTGTESASKAMEEYISVLEDYYNILRRIDQLQAEIALLQAERRSLEGSDDIIESLGREIELIHQLHQEQERLLAAQEISIAALGDKITKEFSGIVTITDGLLQVNMTAYDRLGDKAKERLDEMIQDWDSLNESIRETTLALSDLEYELKNLGQEIVNLLKTKLTEAFEKIEEEINGNIDAIRKLSDEFDKAFTLMQSQADRFDMTSFQREIGLVLDRLAMLEGRRFVITEPTLGEGTIRQNILTTQRDIVANVERLKQIQEDVNNILSRERQTREDIKRDTEDLNNLLEKKREIQTELIQQERSLLNQIEDRQRAHAQIIHNLQQEIENRRKAHQEIERRLQAEIDHYNKLNDSIKGTAFNIERLAQEIALLGVEHDIAVDIGEVPVGEIPTDLLTIYNQVANLAKGINSDLDSQIQLKREIFDLIEDIEKEMRNVTLQYQRQRKELVDQIEQLKKAESERHKFVSDLLDKELKKYEEIINAKLKLLEEEKAERDFQEQIFEEEQERARILAELDVLGLDDSHEARARFLQLQEELAEKEYELNKMHDERTLELRKSNLQQQLDNIRAYIDALRERNDIVAEENNRHLELLEEQLEELDAAYNKEIAILNLFVNHVRDVYQDLNSAIQENIQAMQDHLAHKRQLHSDEIQMMMENLARQQELHRLEIDSLQTKLRGIQELMRFNAYQMKEIFDAQNQMWLDNLEAERRILEQKLKNLQRFLQVYLPLLMMAGIDPQRFAQMAGDIAGGVSLSRGQATGAAATAANLKLRDQDYARTEFWRGTQVATDPASSQDTVAGAINYIKNIIPKESGLTLRDLEGMLTEEELKKLRVAGYDTGGYTGTFPGGKIGILHQKELVLKENDTENILEAVRLMRQVMTNFDTFRASPVSAPEPVGDDVDINIYIDKVMGDREGARLVAKETSKEVLTALKKFGGRTA